MKKRFTSYLIAIVCILTCLTGCTDTATVPVPSASADSVAASAMPTTNATAEPIPIASQKPTATPTPIAQKKVSFADIPAYNGNPYVVLNDNVPNFSETDHTKNSFERYGNLDALKRCTVAYACVGTDLFPTEPRGAIGQIKPSGWHTLKFDFVDGKYLYNRCHLIGYQLSGENANERNLITGTRYMNVSGMLPFENMVADYVTETKNHVLYRVTPLFEGNDLLAKGVQMEALSVEDNGAGIMFHVFCYNVQPNVTIDYATGSATAAEQTAAKSAGAAAGNTAKKETVKNADNNTAKKETAAANTANAAYIGNKSTKKFHRPTCGSVKKMSNANKVTLNQSRDAVISQGYQPCKNCKP